jgi:hypothetical protein
MNLTRYGSSSTTTLVKKSTQGEFLGYSSGSGDGFYLTSGFVYKKVDIFSGEDYGGIYLVPPNASVGDNPNYDPNNYGWIQPESFWRIMEFYSDDGTRSNDFGKNTSTSTTTIPSTGWIPDPRYPQFESSPNGVTAITITAPSGLPSASTGNLRITFADQTNGLAIKNSSSSWSDYLGDGNAVNLEWTGTIWRLRRIESNDLEGIDYPFPAEATNNTSTSVTIPTTGWVYTIGSGPTVTITAA